MSILLLASRWLLAHGATEEGERALRELVQGPEYDQMMADLREQAEEQRKHAKVELRKALVTPELRRQLHIGESPAASEHCPASEGRHSNNSYSIQAPTCSGPCP